MKVWAIIILIGCIFFPHAYAKGTPNIKTHKQKLSYAVGFQVGNRLKNQGMEIDTEVFMQAVKDVMSGTKPQMSENEMHATMQARRQQQMKQRQKSGERNKKEGVEFLAANKKKKGVVVLPSGLQYKVIKKGKGEKPKATDMVVVHYRGALIDGKEFDSSYKRGEPATFKVGGVIKGWQEALKLMHVGSKWHVVIPPTLAYGAHGAGMTIGPNATLVFDIELVSIGNKKKKEEKKK